MLTTQMALAEEHIRDLHVAADRSRLVALARCCRTVTRERVAAHVHRAVARLADRVRRTRVSPVAGYCATC